MDKTAPPAACLLPATRLKSPHAYAPHPPASYPYARSQSDSLEHNVSSARVEPINLHTPTAALLTQSMRCLSRGVCLPRTIWIGCPWYCDLPPLSLLRAWRARFLLGLPPLCCPQHGVQRVCAEPIRSGALARDSSPTELQLTWPSGLRDETVRVIEVRWTDPPMAVINGTIFDVLI